MDVVLYQIKFIIIIIIFVFLPYITIWMINGNWFMETNKHRKSKLDPGIGRRCTYPVS